MEWLYLAVGLVVGFLIGKFKARIITLPAVSGNAAPRSKKPPVLINGRWVYQSEDRA